MANNFGTITVQLRDEDVRLIQATVGRLAKTIESMLPYMRHRSQCKVYSRIEPKAKRQRCTCGMDKVMRSLRQK